MRSTQARRYEMLLRVRVFGEAHRALFPQSSPGGQAFAALDAAVAELGDKAVSKLSTAREGKQHKHAARAAMLAQMDLLLRCAKVVAKDVPGFDDPFRVPRPRSDQALLTTGRVFTSEAAKVEERFVTYGMHKDFLVETTAVVDTFERAVHAWEVGRNGHTAARASIDSALAAGLAAIRKLDIIVVNQFRHDPVTLAVWRQDRRIDGGRRTRRATPDVVEETLAPDPASAPPVDTAQPVAGPGPAPVPGSAVPSVAAGQEVA